MSTPTSSLSPSLVGLPARPTLARYLDFWLAHVAWARLRYTTARTYASGAAHLLGPALGELRVSRLATSDIEKAQMVWQRAGVNVWMRRKAIEVLRSAVRHAVALGLCETNPACRATIPPKRFRPPTWLDAPDAARLLDSTRGHALEACYALVVGLGLRRGEVLGLTWEDVDLRSGVMRVRERRKASAVGALVRPKDPVLTTRTRRPFWTSYLHVELQSRLRQLGLPRMWFHDLRHTAASLMLGEGVSPRTVTEVLGHRNLAVTMFVYGHVNLRHQREAAVIVNRALSKRGGRAHRKK